MRKRRPRQESTTPVGIDALHHHALGGFLAFAQARGIEQDEPVGRDVVIHMQAQLQLGKRDTACTQVVVAGQVARG